MAKNILTSGSGPGGRLGWLLLRWGLPVIGTVVALSSLFWIYRNLDIQLFLSGLATADLVWLPVLAATILLEQLIRGWKWRQILFDLKPVSSLRLFGATLAGYGVAVLVPLGVSPFVRSWLIARLEGLRWAAVLTTAAVERFLDGIVFALFAAAVAMLGQIPDFDGNARAGLAIAGGLGAVLFSALLGLLFVGRSPLTRDDTRISRLIDWLSGKGGSRFDGVRLAVRDGIVWPTDRGRQVAAVSGSVAMKLVAMTHFLWAGLSVGVVLSVPDYLFLMVFAGFALVLTRFIRVPGGFVIGSAFALKQLGVADEQALTMILFNHVLSLILMVGFGLLFLWRSGVTIRQAQNVRAGSTSAYPTAEH